MSESALTSLRSEQALDWQNPNSDIEITQPSICSSLAGSQVPIVKSTRNLEKITFGKKTIDTLHEAHSNDAKVNKGSSKLKMKEIRYQDVIAFGNLIGVNQMGGSVRTKGLFQGIFEGAFQFEKEVGKTVVYFEGKIKQITNKIAIIEGEAKRQRMKGNQFKYQQNADQQKIRIMDQIQNDHLHDINLYNLTFFKGVFRGSFHRVNQQSIDSLNHPKKQEKLKIIKKFNQEGINKDIESRLKTERQQRKKILEDPMNSAIAVYYMIPALLTFDLGKITQINLEKLSANLSGTIKIDIRLNQEIVNILENDQAIYKKQKFEKLDSSAKSKMTEEDIEKIKKPFVLTLDFHRGKLMNLPFYNVDDEDQKQPIEEQWCDTWDGIDLIKNWDPINMIMSYSITTIFTAEISNAYGIFYSPFNLNILKLVLDFHAVKIGKKRININCCDLSDSFNNQKYSPYTHFTALETDGLDNKNEEKEIVFRKHFDRRSKINIDNFVDQGQFKLADNRMTLFPYHKRVFANSELLSSGCLWTLGLDHKQRLIKGPQVRSNKDSYLKILNQPKKKYENFQFSIWEFVHVEIPIFKYAVIDMIRIFVPIMILSTISLLIFVQQNATDGNGFTTLSKRIASGCSLMIAYVALVPLIRAKLPPTPSVTLIQILIYSSTIPNFLAIISNLSTEFIDYDDFFSNYLIFSDDLFIASFIISIFSFTILMIVAAIFGLKNYQSGLIFHKIVPATVTQMRSPIFLDFIKKVKQYRLQYHLEQQELPQILQP